MRYLLFILSCLFVCARAQNDSLNAWLKQQGKDIDIHNNHFRELYAQITPESWLDDVNSRFTNGYDVTLVDTNAVFVSACKYHSCDEKILFWYNTKTQKGMLVAIDVAYPPGTSSPVYYLSNVMTKQEIPQIFNETFNKWLTMENINIGAIEFYMMESDNNSSSSKAEIDSLYKIALVSFKAGKKEDAIATLEYVVNKHTVVLNSTTLSLLNDLAYFLEQTKQYTKAEPILLEITKKFPDRTVAWLNLGDAQLGLGKSDEAKKAYNRYVELMKIAGKEAKIPKRILEGIR
jgi:tetratricopeptide (TPR) repeat protein